MPELPEVETIVQEFRTSQIIGRSIIKTFVFWERTIAIPSPKEFTQLIENQSILDISRRGKFLVFTLTSITLLVHLRMTGKFFISTATKPTPHERAQIWLDNGQIIHFEDQRKFGKWYLIQDSASHLSKMGIEPLSKEFSLKAFSELLKKRNTQIKPFLLNQNYIAGIGNIYADEALWEAKIHPKRSLKSLNNREIASLHSAIIKVLKQGIAHAGTSLGTHRSNYLNLNGKAGGNQNKLNVFRCESKPCLRCHAAICKIVVGQRGTHFCPQCQQEKN